MVIQTVEISQEALQFRIFIEFCFQVQSPLVIVDPVIVEFLVIVDRFCRPIVNFSMYFSRNSGITRYSGYFADECRPMNPLLRESTVLSKIAFFTKAWQTLKVMPYPWTSSS